ncbi:MAG: hypothetical protein Ct9H300mP7_4010 [Verrucomicrobiota bacterium]|nr:MAG: hypothetical protein Ct9H300mP7_4010 [Verrucomicrobiota bacterium]
MEDPSAWGAKPGPKSSSTPCVAGGRLFTAGSTHAHCIDAGTGKQLWATPLPSKGPASFFLVADGTGFLLAGQLTAFDGKREGFVAEQKCPGQCLIAGSLEGKRGFKPVNCRTARRMLQSIPPPVRRFGKHPAAATRHR